MKILTWLIIGLLTVLLFQYALFKENGEPRQISIPVAVVR